MKQLLFLLIILCFVTTENIVRTIEAGRPKPTKSTVVKPTVEESTVVKHFKVYFKALFYLLDATAANIIRGNVNSIIIAGVSIKAAKLAARVLAESARVLAESARAAAELAARAAAESAILAGAESARAESARAAAESARAAAESGAAAESAILGKLEELLNDIATILRTTRLARVEGDLDAMIHAWKVEFSIALHRMGVPADLLDDYPATALRRRIENNSRHRTSNNPLNE